MSKREQAVISRIIAMNEHIQELKDSLAELENEKKDLATLLGEGKFAGDTAVVTVSRRNVFNAAKAEEVLPKNKFKKILELKPSATLAKKVLTGDEYRATQVPSASYIVSVKGI